MVLAREKHGDFIYESALVCLRERLKYGRSGTYYDQETFEEALDILNFGSEEKAWRFLDSRSDYEYEFVEELEVIR